MSLLARLDDLFEARNARILHEYRGTASCAYQSCEECGRLRDAETNASSRLVVERDLERDIRILGEALARAVEEDDVSAGTKVLAAMLLRRIDDLESS